MQKFIELHVYLKKRDKAKAFPVLVPLEEVVLFAGNSKVSFMAIKSDRHIAYVVETFEEIKALLSD